MASPEWPLGLLMLGLVAEEHFEIAEQDRVRGVIRAERTPHWRGPFLEYGTWVGIYITPPVEDAASYTVEVVNRYRIPLGPPCRRYAWFQ